MRKHSPMIEWTIVENDADWEQQCALLQSANEQTDHQGCRRHYSWLVATLLLLLVFAGNRWRTTQDRAQPAAIAEVALTLRNSAPAPSLPNETTIVEQLADRQAVAEFQATITWQSQISHRDTSLGATNPMLTKH